MNKLFIRTIIYTLGFGSLFYFSRIATAQVYSTVNYNISVPTDFAGNFINGNSYKGLGLELGYKLTPNFFAGVRGGWHSFYEERSAREYVVDNVTIYGKQYRYVDSYPILLSVKYVLRDEKEPSLLSPYVGLGMGGYIFKRRMNIGIYNFSDSKTWHWGLQPEAGVLIRTQENLDINAGLRYNQIFGNESVGKNGYLGLFVGILFFPKE